MRSGKLFFLLWLLPSIVLGKELPVGVILRLNDGYNHSVTSLLRGIETAEALYEVLHPGTRITLKIFPHSASLASVSAAADKAVESGVQAVIGGELSEESIVLGDRFSDRQIVLVTPTSSSPQVTENKPFVFRACFSDRQVAELLANYAAGRMRARKIGVLQNISSPYTNYLSEHFTQVLRRFGKEESANGKIELYVEKVLRRTLDFSKQIERFKKSGVTHVAIFSHDVDLLRFVSQAEEQKFHPVYLGSDGWGSNQLVFEHFFGSPRKGSGFVGVRNSYWKEDDERQVTRRFKRAFSERYHERPDAWSAVSFDAAWLLFTAMDGAKPSARGEDIRRALKQLKQIPLVTTPTFTFDDDNSPRKDLYLYRIDRKGIRYEGRLR